MQRKGAERAWLFDGTHRQVCRQPRHILACVLLLSESELHLGNLGQLVERPSAPASAAGEPRWPLLVALYEGLAEATHPASTCLLLWPAHSKLPKCPQKTVRRAATAHARLPEQERRDRLMSELTSKGSCCSLGGRDVTCRRQGCAIKMPAPLWPGLSQHGQELEQQAGGSEAQA